MVIPRQRRTDFSGIVGFIFHEEKLTNAFPSTKDGFLRYCGSRCRVRRTANPARRQLRTDFSGIVGWLSKSSLSVTTSRQRRTDFSGIVGLMRLVFPLSTSTVNVGRISQVLWDQSQDLMKDFL